MCWNICENIRIVTNDHDLCLRITCDILCEPDNSEEWINHSFRLPLVKVKFITINSLSITRIHLVSLANLNIQS